MMLLMVMMVMMSILTSAACFLLFLFIYSLPYFPSSISFSFLHYTLIVIHRPYSGSMSRPGGGGTNRFTKGTVGTSGQMQGQGKPPLMLPKEAWRKEQQLQRNLLKNIR